MTVVTPQIFGYTEEKILGLINLLKSFSYSDLEILKICTNFSSIFSFNLDNIYLKLEFLKNVGLEKVIVATPMILIQNLELTKSRYNFLIEHEVSIASYNYKELYLTDKRFINRHGISKEEILEKEKNKNKKI